MTRRARTLAAGLVAAVACALGGCAGGPASHPGPTAAPCPTSVPGLTTRAATVGLLFSNSGASAAAFAAFRAGVDARFGVANAGGGVGGRRVGYTWADDRSALLPNLSAARRLVESDHDFALLEESADASGSASYLRDAGIPVLGTPYELSWTTFPNMFSRGTYFSREAPASTVGDYARSTGARRTVLITTSRSEAATVANGTLALSLAASGVRVVGTLDASAAKPNVAALAQKVRALKADGLISGGSPEVLARTAIAAKKAGVRLKAVITPFGYQAAVLDRYGRQLPGLTAYLTFRPFEENLPAHRAFLAAMAEYAPQVQPAQSAVALDGWISADMFLRGLRAAGRCPTRSSYMEALRSVNDYDADGLLTTKVDFSADFGKISTCYVFVQVAPSGDRWRVHRPAPQCGRHVGRVLGNPRS